MAYDVVTLGETMLRLTPPLLQRIEQAVQFDIEIGGSESNVAVGLARLGLNVAWVSRLTTNALGQYITNGLRGYGVDVSHVVWTEADRVGLYFLEEGRAPRGSQIIYDRANSAMSRMAPSDLPDDLFQPEAARLLHVSGITPALSDSAAATTQAAVERAKNAGWQLSFDLNYRAKLWSPDAARAGCADFLRAADILFAPIRDARLIYQLDEDTAPAAVLAALRDHAPQAVIVLTLGAEGAAAGLPGADEPLQQPAFPAEAVGRVGGGDAFVAGFLYGYLSTDSVEQALLWGAATAACKYSIPGDMPVINRDEIAAVISGSSGSLRR